MWRNPRHTFVCLIFEESLVCFKTSQFQHSQIFIKCCWSHFLLFSSNTPSQTPVICKDCKRSHFFLKLSETHTRIWKQWPTLVRITVFGTITSLKSHDKPVRPRKFSFQRSPHDAGNQRVHISPHANYSFDSDSHFDADGIATFLILSCITLFLNSFVILRLPSLFRCGRAIDVGTLGGSCCLSKKAFFCTGRF